MPNPFTLPLSQELSSSKNILIAGIGGGFDIYAGLPLYFNLISMQKTVHLANYSFTQLQKTTATQIHPLCYHVTPHSQLPSSSNYFPEKYLCEWLTQQHLNPTVYAFAGSGPKRIAESYTTLCHKLNIDILLLIDGGTDGLMFGDEEHLGTPLQDYTSLAAAHQIPNIKKYLACIGFGIDNISHNCFLENIATITKQGGFLGTHKLFANTNESQLYQSAVEYANQKMSGHESIINNAIIASLNGHLGSEYIASKTRAKNLSIHPLMSQYWFFQLESLIQNSCYYELIKDLNTQDEVIEALHMKLPLVKPMRKTKQVIL